MLFVMKTTAIIFLSFLLFISCHKEVEQPRTPKINETKDSIWSYNPANGFQTVSFDEAGIDSTIIFSILQSILDYQKTSADFRSFLLLKGNRLVFEKYYDGSDENKLNNLKSVTKSITALLIGKSIELGLIKNVDQKLSDFFPEYFNDVNDSLKEKITIQHLLTMSAGFKWNNFGGKYRSGWDLYKGNRHKYMITKTVMKSKPGETYNYNSGLSHMLSGIITNESKMKTEEFAKKYLFEPLGITNYKWTADRNGYNLGNSELFLTSRDMAKIGLLVLRKGYWYDHQLLNSEWVKEMLSPQIETEGIGKKYSQYYGYQWWVKDYKNIRINFAAGYGGQYIFVIPEFDIVLVFTTNWRRSNVSFKPLEITEKLVDSFH
jgi:CubicO group peptidase (beta-lactamase class C family)